MPLASLCSWMGTNGKNVDMCCSPDAKVRTFTVKTFSKCMLPFCWSPTETSLPGHAISVKTGDKQNQDILQVFCVKGASGAWW